MRLFFLMLFAISVISAEMPNKIVYVVSPPRSLSTVLLRTMSMRGDFEVRSEPSFYAYMLLQNPDDADKYFKNRSLSSFEKVKQSFYDIAQRKSVFIKDMSYAVEDFLLADSEFVQNENVQFVFLLRNPHHSAISYCKKFSNELPKDLNYFVGFEPLYNIFQKVKIEAKNKPILLVTEKIYETPQETIRLLCERLDIPFIPEALQWPSLVDNFSGEEWNQNTYNENIAHWCIELIQSSSFTTPHQYEVDTLGRPTFSEIEDPIKRDRCEEAYIHNLHYYNLLKMENDFTIGFDHG